MASKRKASSPLSQAQMKAAGLMVAGLSNEEVAAALKLHPCTVAHWKADERFTGYLTMLQHDANELLLKRVVAASTRALDVLEKMIEDPKATWMQRLTVAGKILEALN